jgi:hypothetical protein
MLSEAVVAKFEILFWYLPRGIREIDVKLQYPERQFEPGTSRVRIRSMNHLTATCGISVNATPFLVMLGIRHIFCLNIIKKYNLRSNNSNVLRHNFYYFYLLAEYLY